MYWLLACGLVAAALALVLSQQWTINHELRIVVPNTRLPSVPVPVLAYVLRGGDADAVPQLVNAPICVRVSRSRRSGVSRCHSLGSPVSAISSYNVGVDEIGEHPDILEFQAFDGKRVIATTKVAVPRARRCACAARAE